MPTEKGYNQYVHTIKSVYGSMGLKIEEKLLPPKSIVGLSPEKALDVCFYLMRDRISSIGSDVSDRLFERPESVEMFFHDRSYLIPIINQEGSDWYKNMEMFVCDFLIESFFGMHRNAKVIYDIGTHQGVWALYYSGVVGSNGRVYAYEPSVVNVECAALSFFINDADNVILHAVGIGSVPVTLEPYQDGLLVGGVRHKINLLPLSQMMWEKPDFIKIDIEGFEYDLLSGMPYLFDLCENIHFEIHIPWLENRGIDYRKIYNMIPFDRFRVRRTRGVEFTDLSAVSVLDGFCTLMLTPVA